MTWLSAVVVGFLLGYTFARAQAFARWFKETE